MGRAAETIMVQSAYHQLTLPHRVPVDMAKAGARMDQWSGGTSPTTTET